jgi:hypothetical protein
MAEISTFPEEHVHPTPTYRRLSLLALGSLLIAVPFTGILAIQAIMCLRNQTPLLLPVMVQLIPIVTAALAVVSLVLIRKSEGVLAGRKLALAALWICVLVCLAYWSYYAATYLAVRQQADKFVQAWMRKLAEGKVVAAFLDTMPPVPRQGLDPEDIDTIEIRYNSGGTPLRKAPLDAFQDSPIARMLNGAGDTMKITPLGVRGWEFKKGGFEINRAYEISVPEGTLTVNLTAVGATSPTGEYKGRGWQLAHPGPQSVTGHQMSELGRSIQESVIQGVSFLNKWWNSLGKRDFLAAYLATKSMEERPRLQADYAAHLLLSAFAAGTAPSVPAPAVQLARWFPAFNENFARDLYLPGFYQSFTKAGIFKTDKLRTVDSKMREGILNNLSYLSGGTSDPAFSIPDPITGGVSAHERWKIEANGMLILPLDCTIGGSRPSLYFNNIGALAVAQLEAPEKAEMRGNPDAWRVVKVDLIKGIDLARMARQMQLEKERTRR